MEMENEMFPVVVQALAGEDYTIFAYMLDGTIRRVSVAHLVAQGGVWEKLKDANFFREALTVLNDTVAWDVSGHADPAECIDLDPFMIAACEAVDDPLNAA